MVSIVIPNFNGADLLRKNLPSVFEACDYYTQEHKRLVEVIVVDDGSTDDSPYYLEELAQRLDYKPNFFFKPIILPKNEGFSVAMNAGINQTQYKVIIALNNDVMVQKDFIYPLVQHFNDQKVFSVKCKSILADGRVESVRQGFVQKGLVQSRINDQDLPSGSLLLYSDAGSCAFERSKLKELGLFDTLYSPFYFEDFDLGYRALKRGWKNVYEPKSIVHHESGQTVKKVVKDMANNPVFIRNRELFNIKNVHHKSSRIQARVGLFLKFIKSIVSFNTVHSRAYWETYMMAHLANQHHTQDKKHEVISDTEIFKVFGIK